MTGVIYILTCPGGRSYVGKTKRNLNGRLNSHKRSSSSCRAIRDALNLHGNAMKVSVLMKCPEGDMDVNETLYIQKLDTVYPRGYNLRCGNMAAKPESEFTLSTWQHTPVQYTDETDKDDVERAVKEAVCKLLSEDGGKPWSGPIQISVADLNAFRNAKQYCTWTGPMKGVPVVEAINPNVADEQAHLKRKREDEEAHLKRMQKLQEDDAADEEAHLKRMREIEQAHKKRKRENEEAHLKQKQARLKLQEKINYFKSIGDDRRAEHFSIKYAELT